MSARCWRCLDLVTFSPLAERISYWLCMGCRAINRRPT